MSFLRKKDGSLHTWMLLLHNKMMFFLCRRSISFWHSGSTESGFDKLVLSMDGVQQATWDGVWGWTNSVQAIPAGVHTFVWTYSKDVSINSGRDQVWVDLVEVTNGAPI